MVRHEKRKAGGWKADAVLHVMACAQVLSEDSEKKDKETKSPLHFFFPFSLRASPTPRPRSHAPRPHAARAPRPCRAARRLVDVEPESRAQAPEAAVPHSVIDRGQLQPVFNRTKAEREKSASSDARVRSPRVF